MEGKMAKISYPEDWIGPESIALVVNYAELSKLANANGLNSGHLNYLVQQVNDTVLGSINRILEEEPTDDHLK
jgi:hypothetical protein